MGVIDIMREVLEENIKQEGVKPLTNQDLLDLINYVDEEIEKINFESDLIM